MLRVTGLCAVPGEFPARMASNAENISIWWRQHVLFYWQSFAKTGGVDNFLCHNPYPEPVVFQWQSSGNPVCLELRPQCTLECHWRNVSVLPVVFQWLSSGLPVCSNYANKHCIATGTPLGASISQCGSSCIPVYLWLQWSSSVFQLCKLTLDRHWNTTGC